MCLNIYIGKENLPRDKGLIFDVESFFQSVKIPDCAFTRKVIETVENGVYVDDETYRDRFGRGLYTTTLSTGSKILLAVYLNPNYVFMGDEIGENAIDLLLDCTEGNIFFTRNDIEFQGDLKLSVSLNGVEISDLDDLNMSIS